MTTPVGVSASLLPSITRTVVPLLVGLLVTGLLKLGINIDEGLATQLVAALVTAVYYTAVRFLETRGSNAWGWLLGLARQPAYAPVAPAPEPEPAAPALSTSPDFEPGVHNDHPEWLS